MMPQHFSKFKSYPAANPNKQINYFVYVFQIFCYQPMRRNEDMKQEKHSVNHEKNIPKLLFAERPQSTKAVNNHQVCYQKNYPKNIFIPLIEYLNEVGLKQKYQRYVGTRESIQAKNVVSLIQIHKVMSQKWFRSNINSAELIFIMSNKILINMKIKKKLFHLLVIKELFGLPLKNGAEFRRMLSQKANEISLTEIAHDPLFDYPNSVQYLVSLFAECLLGKQNDRQEAQIQQKDGPCFFKKYSSDKQIYASQQDKKREMNYREEYRTNIARIINFVNEREEKSKDLDNFYSDVKWKIEQRERQIRNKYELADRVPCWSYFSSIVVINCECFKRKGLTLTHSTFNEWIEEFKSQTLSLQGLRGLNDIKMEANEDTFMPIVLVSPPA